MLHCVEKQVFGPQKYLSSQKKKGLSQKQKGLSILEIIVRCEKLVSNGKMHQDKIRRTNKVLA